MFPRFIFFFLAILAFLSLLASAGPISRSEPRRVKKFKQFKMERPSLKVARRGAGHEAGIRATRVKREVPHPSASYRMNAKH